MRDFCYAGGALPVGEKTYIVGILNATPDSFSDGGKYFSRGAISRRSEQLLAEGADIIDLGCESTRPGYVPVSEEDEISRIMIALPEVKKSGALISIDTIKETSAAVGLRHGAKILNTVCDITKNKELVALAAKYKAGLIITHNREFSNLEEDMLDYFTNALHICELFRLPIQNIILDPGVGFGKDERESARAVRMLPRLAAFGASTMLAASRKRLIGAMCGAPLADIAARDVATAQLSAIAASQGVDFLRVHNVPATVAAVKVAEYLRPRAGAQCTINNEQ